MEEEFKRILNHIDPLPNRDGLNKTPKRASDALLYMTSGHTQNLKDIIGDAIYNYEGSDDKLVIIKDIDFFSLCEHHLLPFWGRCHIGYVPDKKILGLSKFARVVEMFAHRLQVQERFTKEILYALSETINPKGIIVYVEGTHCCMVMRGVEKVNSTTTTIETIGDITNVNRDTFFHTIKN